MIIVGFFVLISCVNLVVGASVECDPSDDPEIIGVEIMGNCFYCGADENPDNLCVNDFNSDCAREDDPDCDGVDCPVCVCPSGECIGDLGGCAECIQFIPEVCDDLGETECSETERVVGDWELYFEGGDECQMKRYTTCSYVGDTDDSDEVIGCVREEGFLGDGEGDDGPKNCNLGFDVPLPCYFSSEKSGDCGVEGAITVAYSPVGDSADTCLAKSLTYPCPSATKMPFFGIFNLISAVLIIVVVYGFMLVGGNGRSRKKRE